MTPEASNALFEWVFIKPSHMPEDDNENIIYAHRNVDQIRKMKLHDDTHGTSFTAGFKIDNPSEAIPMRVIFDQRFQAKLETTSKAKILEDLLKQLEKLDVKEMAEEGEALQILVQQVFEISQQVLDHLSVAQNG